MARSKTGEANSARGRSPSGRQQLSRFIRAAEKAQDLGRWRRGGAVLGYIEGGRVADMAAEFGVDRSSINRWLMWYEAQGVEGLVTGTAPGPAPRLSENERMGLVELVEQGPASAG
jgi:transposase